MDRSEEGFYRALNTARKNSHERDLLRQDAKPSIVGGGGENESRGKTAKSDAGYLCDTVSVVDDCHRVSYNVMSM